jgi:hypothetical protein
MDEEDKLLWSEEDLWTTSLSTSQKEDTGWVVDDVDKNMDHATAMPETSFTPNPVCSRHNIPSSSSSAHPYWSRFSAAAERERTSSSSSSHLGYKRRRRPLHPQQELC